MPVKYVTIKKIVNANPSVQKIDSFVLDDVKLHWVFYRNIGIKH